MYLRNESSTRVTLCVRGLGDLNRGYRINRYTASRDRDTCNGIRVIATYRTANYRKEVASCHTNLRDPWLVTVKLTRISDRY